MAFVHCAYNFVVVWLMLLLHAKDGGALTYTIPQPPSASGIQGQNVTITWTANLGAGETWDNVRVDQEVTGRAGKQRMIRFSKTTGRLVYSAYTNRSADLNLTVSLSGTLLTVVFTMRNLNRSTDEHLYSLRIIFSDNVGDSDSRDSADLQLTVLVPPTITSPDPSPGTVTVNETQTAQLVCTATGNLPPKYNWTRDGVIVGTGSPFTTPAVSFNDDNACYTCIAYNDLDAKTANVCLNVQYKPRSTLSLVSAKSTVCQNDTVSLTCTSGPANPAPSSYEFYDNGVLVGTSASNVYEAKVTVGIPAVNKFVCVPRNLLGAALENASVEVSAKVAPIIVTPPQATSVVEGRALTLFCNASGVPAPNITWSKVGGSIVDNSETYTISNVTRGDEGTYRCTASNGDECSNITAEAEVVVNYPPENTAISTNQSENTFLKGSSVRLSCVSLSKPQLCNVTFYRGNTVLQSYYDKTCAGVEAASHVIQNIDGCNLEEYSCKVENQYGQQEAKVNLTIKVPPTISTSPAADVILEEGSSLQLNCTAAGCPTPNITWTKIGNSASLQSGNGFFLSHRISSLSKSDTGDYKCSVDNGVVGSPVERTIHVNVTYKPESTTLTSSKNTACLNDPVTLQCTTNANPPAYEYRFYLNDVLVHTSMSGAYQVNVPQAGNNEYKCEPVNTVGAGQNATVTITLKAPPNITWSTPDQTLVEGERLVLMCNVTGSEPLNVTWSKVGGSSYPEGYSYTFSSIGRGDEATYRCTAHNGNECPVATATSSITVIYKPENTNLTHNKSSDVFLLGEPVKLTCESQAKPSDCHVLFYQGSTLLANISSSTCTASHVISSIDGCNEESFSCFAMNEAGTGDRVYKNVTVQVPANMSITPSTDPVIMEGQALSLNCSVTGCPTPNITWTKEGVAASLASENSFFLSYPLNSLTKVDTGRYKCSVDNGVVGSPLERTIYVNVTYKPTSTSLTSPVSNACLNDSVTLQCTTDANPPAHEYRFYLNDVLVHTSMSGTYQVKVPQAGNNEYKCEPVNTVGAGENGTTTITAKAPPMITWSTPDQTLVEGERLVLMCNVTGSEPLNVTWSKVGGSSYPEGYSYTFSSIGRADEATYRCTAHNGNECPVATATSSITVIYKPENTNLTHNKSNDVFLLGEPVKLTCESQAKPSDCHVLFYQGSTLMANKSSSTCTASHVISSIDGCNDESFSCFAMNEAGTGDSAYKNVTVQVPANMSITPSTDPVIIEEGQALSLNCNATGCPTPNITWTKEGVAASLASENSFFLSYPLNSLTKVNTGRYKCSVDNGVVGSPLERIIYVNVTYKPTSTSLTSPVSNACLNDSVTLQCTTDANPPVYEYRFYLNDVLVHTSMSGVYQLKVPQAGNNEYKCEPVNTVGAGQNATTTITAKAPPMITWSTPDQTVVEGSAVVLMCNVSGSEPLNVTWSKVGGSSYPEGYSYNFSSIGRADEATYLCTAHNGNECPVATATSSIAVIYKPEKTNITHNKSSDVFVYGEPVKLTCESQAKPSDCHVLFYQGSTLLANISSSTCTASHVISSIDGCNEESFSCYAMNEAGTGDRAYKNVTVQVPPGASVVPSSDNIVKVEGEALTLRCTPSGCPTPTVTWTKTGVSSPLEQGSGGVVLNKTFASLTKQDTGIYQCTVNNGVVGSPAIKTIYLNVTYKPYRTNLTSSLSNACLNDSVTLQCTTDANPPVYEYRFYLNDVLVHTSMSGVYQLKVPQAGNNEYKCEPVNTVGAGENGTTTIATKAPPQITWSTPDQTLVEGERLVLMCNVSGSDPLNVTWSKVGGSSYPEGYSYPFSSIGRADEATYRCTAHNGNECPVATATSSITVIYKPEKTNMTHNKSIDDFVLGEPVKLTCESQAKPSACRVLFYHGSQLLANESSSTCTASHVISSISGCNDESFSCYAMNEAGTGDRAYKNVTVQVPPGASVVPSSDNIVKVEGEALTLSCTPSGCPTPTVTWTKTGVSSPLEQGSGGVVLNKTFASLMKQDTGTYQCTVNNGVVGSPAIKTIYLNVTYKPYLTNLTSTRSNACLNDSVTLQCTTDANPPVYEYRFYLNDVLVHTSMSGVYQLKVPQAGNNEYKCEPMNTVGAGENGTTTITAKAPPQITWSTPDQTVVEGSAVVLMCNVTGSEPLNVTWSKVGGSSYPEGYNYTFSSIGRRDEATYLCTAHNGNECPVVNATSSITVIYKPEKTNLTHNKSSDVFLIGEPVLLTCESQAKPSDCHVLFYHGSQLLANKSSSTCTASHVVSSISGCNDESFSCYAMNEAGTGDRAYKNVTVQVPPGASVVPSSDVIVKVEGEALTLSCTPSGCPTPTVTWTKTGVSSPLEQGSGGGVLNKVFGSLLKQDTGTYQCNVSNGVVGSPAIKTIYLNVTYKPYLTNLTSSLSNACLNDSVTLQCTTDANPPVYEYRFYLNDVLVHTSMSGVYQVKVPQAGNNEYKCEPVNTVGAGENGTTTVATKAPPQITWSTPDQTLVEGERLVLMCNVTGSEPLNVTWSKVGGSSYPEGYNYTFSSIGRADEATYRCTAHNGNECPVATATSSITVIYKPENTNLTHNKSSDVFIAGEPVKLTCESQANPSCHVLFYQGSQLLANKSSSTCTASHVISSISGCNGESFSCFAVNEVGTGDRAYKNVTVQVPPAASVVPSSDTVVKVEGETLTLSCTPSGCPTPTVTWTKAGVSSPLEQGSGGGVLNKTFASLTKQDTGTYQCNVSNGVVGSPAIKTIYLNVTYTPTSTSLTSTLSNACLNDSVTLQCTTDANPPVYEYRFYLNDVLVHTSMSGVYQLKVPQAGNNEYKCEPVNTVGAGQNGTTTITAKAPPMITWSTPDQTLVEGERLVLMCNVTGSEPLNVTWSKVGGSSYPEGYNYTFSSIGRADEATYRCTAHNGNECPVATATSSITVIYPPENIVLSLNKSINILMVGEAVNLTCQSSAKPSQCTILFYQGDQLLANKSSTSCTESLVISSVQGCNEESFSCVVKNQVGTGTRTYKNVTIQSPATISIIPSTNSIIQEEGSSLVLNCTTTGCPSPNITWSRDGAASFAQGSGYQLVHDFGSLGKDDTGTYACRVDNGVLGSMLVKAIYVNVTYKPYQTNITSNTTSTCLDDRVMVTCVSNANPPFIEYLFFFNGQQVHTSTTGFYELNAAQPGTNLYTCKPRNAIGIGISANVSIVTKAPPVITRLTGQQTVNEGVELTIVCNASGTEPLNTTLIKRDGRYRTEGSSLTLPVVNRNDEGEYICTVHNGNECPVATSTTRVTVNYKPENTNLTASVATACRGDRLTLTCDTHAKPVPTSFRFYENDMLIQTQSAYTYTFALSVSGSNVYKCVPENSAGNGTAANATVRVKAAPVITYVTPTQDVVEGSNLTLVCNVTDQSGVLNVSWHKVGGGRVSISNTYALAPAGRNDTGSYVCKAHNGNECDVQTKNVSITVTYPAVIVSHSNTSVKSNENDQIVLVCRVSGFPTPMINWTRNGQMISNAHGETYTFNGLESLSGNYSCVVGNGVGAVQRKTFAVMIQGFCKDHRCRFGATCRSEGQSYRCLCTRGLTGRYCEIEDPIHAVFDCLLVIVEPQWKPGYAVAKSNDFHDLEFQICTKMFLIFNEGPRAIQGIILVTCVLISARQGSTYANTELTFNETATRSKVFEAINSGIVNQTVFGNLTLRSSAALEVNPKTDPCSSEPCKFNSKCTVHGVGYRCECDVFRYGTHCEKGIGLIPGIIIILACIFIIIILIILCVLYCKRRKSETYPSAAAENGTQMKTYYLPDHEGAAANAQVTTTDEKPPVNGQQQEVYRQNGKEDLIYADLCFKDDANKEKIETLPPEKSETLYADIVSFQQNSEEEPKDVPLAEEAIELTEKEPETTNTEPEKETNGSKPTDNEDPEGTGANETSVKPENQYTPSPTKDNLV